MPFIMRNWLEIQTPEGGFLIGQESRLALDRQRFPGFRHYQQLQTLIFVLRMARKLVALAGMLPVRHRFGQVLRG